VLGTRPEAIKLAFVVDALGTRARIIHTGQHYDATLAQNILDDLAFPPPDESLGVGGTSRARQIGDALVQLDALFEHERPDVVVVQGDTNATVAGALAANAAEIPLVHVEAGLRSHDRRMPEEHNRIVTDHLSDLCCAPTEVSAANLAAEGVDPSRVVVTGNTVVEAVVEMLPPPEEQVALAASLGLEPESYIVATLHRPENVDVRDTVEAILAELAGLPLPVVLPLHPRSLARIDAFGLTSRLSQLRVVEPMPPRAFLGIAARAVLWVSDSGGLQEEASVLKRPVIVVRRSTERPEVQGTFATLVEPSGIGAQAATWLADIDALHHRLAALPSPYGDGSASTRIVAEIERLLRS
jgi:UDP-N-acetylglucosamine 2-epimerase (non-hydrolysing)